MADAASRSLRVALIAEQKAQGRNLKELLETNGLEVILDQSIRDYDPDAVALGQVDVLLVNLDEDASQEMERLETLIERSQVPILFNEGGIPGGRGWGRKLISKLSGLAQAQTRALAAARQQVQAQASCTEVTPAGSCAAEQLSEAPRTSVADQRPALRVIDTAQDQDESAQIVWVLGASLGGPQALKEFLMYLPEQLPVGFVVAQHIGKPFVPLLAEQLDRVAKLRVRPAEAGYPLRMGEVVLVPVDRRFALADDGRVELRDEPIRGPYKPCIDEVMEEVARHYGAHCHVIVFSGMGEDGALGALAVTDAGGQVWAQSAESCVISSMPDAARRRGVVCFSGSPQELAIRLAEHCAAEQIAGR